MTTNNLKKILNLIRPVIKRRLSEPSTKIGLFILLGTLGFNFTPEEQNVIWIIATLLIGIPDKQHV